MPKRRKYRLTQLTEEGGIGMRRGKYDAEPLALTPEQKLNQAQRLLWRVIARMVKVIDDEYGEKGLAVISKGLRDWDFWKLSISRAGLEPGKVNLRDLITKVYGPGDALLFTMTEKPVITEEPDENRVLYKIPVCNAAGIIARECPKTCMVVSRAIEEGVAKVANPNLRVFGDKLLGTGDDACEIFFEVTNMAPRESAARKRGSVRSRALKKESKGGKS